ncbi:hypothetical protein GQX74_011609, partial [Glossina fuscipes]
TRTLAEHAIKVIRWKNGNYAAFHSASWAHIMQVLQDMAIVFAAKRLQQIQEVVGRAPSDTNAWVTSKKLSLASQKTEAVLVTSRRREKVVLNIDDHEICTTPKIKYFVVVLDATSSFLPNFHALCHKARRAHAAFLRMMSNVGESSQGRRLLLGKVVLAILIYTSPIRNRSSYAKIVEKLIRTTALRVT